MHSLLLTLVLPAVAAQGPGNEAERRYRDLERRLVAAKTVRVSCTIRIEGGPQPDIEIRGSFDLAEGDRARLEFRARVKGKDELLTAVSDGTKLRRVDSRSGKEIEQLLPKNFGRTLRTGLSRLGALGVQFVMDRPGGGGDIETYLRLSEFRAGGAARTVAFKIEGAGASPLMATVWIDEQTGLPLKREMSTRAGDQTVRFFETYSEFSAGLAAPGFGLGLSTGTPAPSTNPRVRAAEEAVKTNLDERFSAASGKTMAAIDQAVGAVQTNSTLSRVLASRASSNPMAQTLANRRIFGSIAAFRTEAAFQRAGEARQRVQDAFGRASSQVPRSLRSSPSAPAPDPIPEAKRSERPDASPPRAKKKAEDEVIKPAPPK